MRITRAIRAPAKINLTLEVVQRLPDGYHALRSVMMTLPGVEDHVGVESEAGTPQIMVRVDSSQVPTDERNICHRVAARFLERTGARLRVSITLRKNVPVAAGLGGGSSDAAAVLLALNRHCDDPLSSPELVAVALDVGRDIPFFLASTNAAVVSGTGEVVDPFDPHIALHALIVNPRIPVPTGPAYEALSRALWFMSQSGRTDRTSAMVAALRAGDLAATCSALYNDFELVVEPMHPIVKELKQALLAFGARGASLSGSGPSVFGLFANDSHVVAAEQALRSQYPRFFITRVTTDGGLDRDGTRTAYVHNAN